MYRQADPGDGLAKDYLSSLLPRILASFGGTVPVKADLDVGDLAIDAKRLSAIGIIVNELVTNSVKHAFSDVPEPRISLSFGSSGGKFILSYRDNGPSMPASLAGHEGFGMVLVNGLVEQLEGTMTMEGKPGTAILIEFKA